VRTTTIFCYEILTKLTVRNNFNVAEIDFQPKPIREQKALFYATAVPLKILRITASGQSSSIEL